MRWMPNTEFHKLFLLFPSSKEKEILWDYLLSHRFHSPNPGHSPKLDKFQILLIFNPLYWQRHGKKTPKLSRYITTLELLSKLSGSLKGVSFESEVLLWKNQNNTKKPATTKKPLMCLYSYTIEYISTSVFLEKYPDLLNSLPLPPTM